MRAQNSSLWQLMELHTSQGGQITQSCGQSSTENEVQFTIGQGANAQSGGTLPTVEPSGHNFASAVHAVGGVC
jgi:hypothetical protein